MSKQRMRDGGSSGRRDIEEEDSDDDSIYRKKVPRKAAFAAIAFDDIDSDSDDSDDSTGLPTLHSGKYDGDSDDDNAPIPGIRPRRASRWGPPVSEISFADPNAMRYMRMAEERPLHNNEKKVRKDSNQNSIFIQHLVEGHNGKLSNTRSFRQAYVAKDLTKVCTSFVDLSCWTMLFRSLFLKNRWRNRCGMSKSIISQPSQTSFYPSPS
jgi:hypothetical protein